jgi:hypothetical protein
LTAPEATLEWLADRARISDLLYSFASALDTRNWQEYADNYADGGFIELPDPTSSTSAIFTLHKHQMIELLLTKSLGASRARITSAPIIRSSWPATKRVRSYLQAVHVTGAPTDHWSAGGWLTAAIAARRQDGSSPASSCTPYGCRARSRRLVRNESAKTLDRGGGIAGMSLAIRMREAGWEVDLVEIDPEWRVYGAGISITAPTYRAAKRWARHRRGRATRARAIPA